MKKRLFDIVSSKGLLLFLLGGWIFFYVTYAVFSKEAFAFFMLGLKEKLYIQLPFAAFIASLGLYSLRRAAELGKSPLRLALWLPLSIGFVVFLSGALMSAALRQEEKRLVGEGDIYSPPWRQSVSYEVKKIIPGIKDETFKSERSEGGLFSYEPKVVLAGEDLDRGREYNVGVFPPRRINGVYYHILQFGLAPGVRIYGGQGLLDEGILALRLLPPGVEDEFRLQSLPHLFRLKIAPERVEKKGESSVAFYNLKRPTYEVEVIKGDETVSEGTSSRAIDFDGAYRLEFDPPGYWVWLEVVEDPGVLPLAAGIFLIALGLPLRVFLLALQILGNRLSSTAGPDRFKDPA